MRSLLGTTAITSPALLDLIERAKSIPITPEMRAAQRRSYVVGETMFAHPNMSREEADALYDRVVLEIDSATRFDHTIQFGDGGPQVDGGGDA